MEVALTLPYGPGLATKSTNKTCVVGGGICKVDRNLWLHLCLHIQRRAYWRRLSPFSRGCLQIWIFFWKHFIMLSSNASQIVSPVVSPRKSDLLNSHRGPISTKTTSKLQVKSQRSDLVALSKKNRKLIRQVVQLRKALFACMSLPFSKNA